MNGFAETIADLVQRLARRPRAVWVWRAVMLACGLGAQLWIMALRPLVVLAFVALCAVVLAVIVPRTVVPLLAAALIVLEAAMVRVTVVEAVPLAVALLGWHVAASALSAARPWARVESSVWRALLLPTLASLGGIAVTIPFALTAGALTLPPLALVSIALVLLAALGLLLVLWPASATTRR